MRAKHTSKNQLILPRTIVQKVGDAGYYDVTTGNGRSVFTAVRLRQADAVRAKLAELGIAEDSVKGAVSWVRKAR